MKKNRKQQYKVFAFLPSFCLLAFAVSATVVSIIFSVRLIMQGIVSGGIIIACCGVIGVILIALVCSLFQYVEFGEKELILKHQIFGIMKKIPYANMEIELLHVRNAFANFPFTIHDKKNNNLICFYNKEKNPKKFKEGGANIIGKDRFHVIFTPEFYANLQVVLQKDGLSDILPKEIIFKDSSERK